MKEKEYIYKFNLVSANVLSILIFILMCILTVCIKGTIILTYSSIGILLIAMILYFAFHEVLHGIGYYLGGCKVKNIYYGIALEKGILYCLARQEVKKSNILLSLQMPFTVIGVITYIIGLIINDNMLLFLSIANIAGASMDLVMFFYILRIKSVRYSETDANDEFVLISKEDLSKRKSIFFKLKEVKDYNEKDFIFKKMKRVEVSKKSIILLLFLLALSIITIIIK